MIVLPGGRLGTENLGKNEIVREQCKVFAVNKYVAAVCAAPLILAELGLLDGKKATVHPDFEGEMNGAMLTGDSVTVDGNIVTGQGLGATIPFTLKLVEALVGVDVEERIKKAICYR